MELILSLFPGIDILGRAFESNGFAVVRGNDLILDQTIEESHYPAGKFDGIIGGPPCQNYSDANRRRNPAEGDRLVGHFLRIVAEAQPSWFLMENVRNVPTVAIAGYAIQRLHITDHECGGTQRRLRVIQFGSRDASIIRPLRTNNTKPVTPALLCRLTSKHDRHSRRAAKQGVPQLRLRALTPRARTRAIGNAVSYTMAKRLARAITSRSPAKHDDCPCRCGRTTTHGTLATAACRKRMERQRKGTTRVLHYEQPPHPSAIAPHATPTIDHAFHSPKQSQKSPLDAFLADIDELIRHEPDHQRRAILQRIREHGLTAAHERRNPRMGSLYQ